MLCLFLCPKIIEDIFYGYRRKFLSPKKRSKRNYPYNITIIYIISNREIYILFKYHSLHKIMFEKNRMN